HSKCENIRGYTGSGIRDSWQRSRDLYHPGDGRGYPTTAAYGLCIDSKSRVWVGNGRGLSVIENGNVTNYYEDEDGLSDRDIYRIIETRDGTIWIGTSDGLNRVREDGSFEIFRREDGLVGNRIRSLLESTTGELWIGTVTGVSIYDGTSFRSLTLDDGLSGSDTNALFEQGDSIWLGSHDGLSCYQDGRLTSHQNFDGRGRTGVREIVQASDGLLWLATDWGIYRKDDRFLNYAQEDGLPSDRILDIEVVENDVWLGFEWDGVARFRNGKATTVLHKVYCADVYKTDDGELYFATDKGLHIWNGHTPELVEGTRDIHVMSVLKGSEGELWLGQGWAGEGIYRLDRETGTIERLGMDPENPIGRVRSFALRDGTLWAGSSTGIYRQTVSGFEFVSALGSRSFVWDILKDRNDTLWFSMSPGLRVFNDEGPALLGLKDGMPDRVLRSAIQLSNGRYALSSQNGGVCFYDPKLAVFTALDSRDGLASEDISATSEDADGNLWIATRRSGLARYKPYSHPPSVKIESLIVDAASRPTDISSVEIDSGSHVVLQYDSIDFRSSREKRQFLCRWSHQEKPWITTSTRQEWVPKESGTYTFEVSAIDSDLNRSDQLIVRFDVEVPWYISSWCLFIFAAASGFLLVYGIYFSIRFVAKRRHVERLQHDLLTQATQNAAALEERARELEVANAAHQSAKLEAEKASREKSRFLANISHEIRTPLNAVLGFAQVLQRSDELPTSFQEPLHSIRSSGQHLLSLVGDVLDLSKIEAGKLEIVDVDFDLNCLITELSVMFRWQCTEKSLRWELKTWKDEECFVTGDDRVLRQVLINLIGNAVKYTDAGTVQLDVGREGDQFRFAVRDSGHGIRPDKYRELLEPFARGDDTGSSPGSGLGLPIAKACLEALGSRLQYQDRKPNGAEFSFLLTLKPSASRAQF
ncbi:MAG: two-component regulator propeller domain-containing protein, partial [Planctomycetota bacterium]